MDVFVHLIQPNHLAQLSAEDRHFGIPLSISALIGVSALKSKKPNVGAFG